MDYVVYDNSPSPHRRNTKNSVFFKKLAPPKKYFQKKNRCLLGFIYKPYYVTDKIQQ